VFADENGTSSRPFRLCQKLSPSSDRSVKYIANSAAKNISSDDSQTMVPTATRFGRFAGGRVTVVSTAAAVATATSCH
jgi:hypothetical protein